MRRSSCGEGWDGARRVDSRAARSSSGAPSAPANSAAWAPRGHGAAAGAAAQRGAGSGPDPHRGLQVRRRAPHGKHLLGLPLQGLLGRRHHALAGGHALQLAAARSARTSEKAAGGCHRTAGAAPPAQRPGRACALPDAHAPALQQGNAPQRGTRPLRPAPTSPALHCSAPQRDRQLFCCLHVDRVPAQVAQHGGGAVGGRAAAGSRRCGAARQHQAFKVIPAAQGGQMATHACACVNGQVRKAVLTAALGKACCDVFSGGTDRRRALRRAGGLLVAGARRPQAKRLLAAGGRRAAAGTVAAASRTAASTCPQRLAPERSPVLVALGCRSRAPGEPLGRVLLAPQGQAQAPEERHQAAQTSGRCCDSLQASAHAAWRAGRGARAGAGGCRFQSRNLSAGSVGQAEAEIWQRTHQRGARGTACWF